MRLHLLEHDDMDFSNTNISMWAEKKEIGWFGVNLTPEGEKSFFFADTKKVLNIVLPEIVLVVY